MRGTWLLLMGFFVGCGVEPDQPPRTVEAPPADQVATDLVHFITVEGVRKVRLEAGRGLFYADRQVVEFEDVRVVFFGPSGRETSVLTGKGGRLDQGTEEMEAWGDVVVVSSDGDRLETDRLRYEPGTHKIVTESRVVLRQGRSVVRGSGLRSDPGLTTVEVLHPEGELSGRR